MYTFFYYMEKSTKKRVLWPLQGAMGQKKIWIVEIRFFLVKLKPLLTLSEHFSHLPGYPLSIVFDFILFILMQQYFYKILLLFY